MQKMRSLEFGLLLKGEIVLVFDPQEVALRAGDIVILRETNHARNNRSTSPAQMAL